MKILANDGIAPEGEQLLKDAGFEVSTDKVAQEELVNVLPQYDAILVRSATTVRQELIDACPNLKVIGRGGVGLDNIDVDYAKSKGIEVLNTPGASSQSVAELAIAHLMNAVRFLYDANRKMPDEGASNFGGLKKSYSKGIEVGGKTMGIIGYGKIGQAVGKMAEGLGMNVLATDPYVEEATASMEEVITGSDFISVHVPFGKGSQPLIGKTEFEQMKDGVGIINTARGGIVSELALIEALNSGKVAFAALDVFENEPTPSKEILSHPRISLTPHIGASTVEAQTRTGTELAEKVIQALNAVSST